MITRLIGFILAYELPNDLTISLFVVFILTSVIYEYTNTKTTKVAGMSVTPI